METTPSQAQSVMARATRAIGLGLSRTKPGTILNSSGYVQDPAENLLDDISLQDFEADLRQGDGKELEGKFRAAHSSSALAVNNFAPFKRRPGSLSLAGIAGVLQFERKCPTGLKGTPPNLDLVIESDNGVVGVESKCTEFLCRHIAKFRPAYPERIRDERRSGPWFAEMMRLIDDPTNYAWLDAAQLVKHAFGLARTFHRRRTILFYLFWEPTNASSFSIFDEHRQEISTFSSRVAGGFPEFRAMSYRELWRDWESGQPPDWLRAHLQRLRARYEIAI